MHPSSPPASAFSHSTPARARSPLPSVPFVDESPVPTQLLTQPSIPITPARHPHAPPLLPLAEDIRAMETDLEYQEEDILITARACIDSREFMRAIHLLKECRSSKACFLSIYCQFIVSELIYHLPTLKHINVYKASEKTAQRDWHKLDSRFSFRINIAFLIPPQTTAINPLFQSTRH